MSGRAFCTVSSPLTLTLCSINDLRTAKIVYKATTPVQSGSYISGSISFFKNPDSAKAVTGITF
jgi:hypothetical protein